MNNNTDDIEQDNNTYNGRSSFSIFIDQQEKKCPRTFSIVFFVTLPLLFLISQCMFCGHFLAMIEKDSELKANDASIASFYKETTSFDDALEAVQRTYDGCIDKFISSTSLVATADVAKGLKSFMEECTSDGADEYLKFKDDFASRKLEELKYNTTSFHWNTCSEDGSNIRRPEQGEYIHARWVESKDELYAKYTAESDKIDEKKALQDAIANASASDVCTTNSPGGAMFWFTVMTTIGYGNTAPVTNGGQIFVMSLGFISILAFGAVSGAAGYVVLTIVDDFLKRRKLEKLTKGWGAVAVWFVTLLLSVITVALIVWLYQKDRYLDEERTAAGDLFWFAFISITTVGLGDSYIPHETFRQMDMFYIPLSMLFGFVCLTNFLIKLSEKVVEIIKNTGIVDDESLEFLLAQTRSKDDGPPRVIDSNEDDNEVDSLNLNDESSQIFDSSIHEHKSPKVLKNENEDFISCDEEEDQNYSMMIGYITEVNDCKIQSVRE